MTTRPQGLSWLRRIAVAYLGLTLISVLQVVIVGPLTDPPLSLQWMVGLSSLAVILTAAIVIVHLRLDQWLQQRTRTRRQVEVAGTPEVARLVAAAEVGRLLTSHLDLETTMLASLRELRWLVTFNRASLILTEEDRRLAVWTLNDHKHLTRDGWLTNDSSTRPGYVLATGELVYDGDIAAQPRFAEDPGLIQRYGLRTILSVPLAHNGVCLGTLNLGHEAADAFSEMDVAVVSTVAGSLAVAIENSRQHQALGASERRYRALIRSVSDLIVILDRSATLQYISPAVERNLGYGMQDLIGSRLASLIHPDDGSHLRELLGQVDRPASGATTIELRLRHRDGHWRHCEVACQNLLDDPSVNGIVLNAWDITDRKGVEAQLAHQASHDPLTNLPNRSLFAERLSQALAEPGRQSGTLAVLFVDLDRFKEINDTLGHDAGDELLRAVTQRLNSAVRQSDTVARFGGDEFTVLLDGLTHADDPLRVAGRILRQVSGMVTLRQQTVPISASIGLAINRLEHSSPDDLLREADVALYRAKAAGRNQVVVYESAPTPVTINSIALDGDLRRGIERDELLLHYQPEFDLISGKIVGLEALVRWQHPKRGLLPPSTFIELAKEHGLIIPLGRWVLEQACRQMQSWQERYPQESPLTVSVNLAAEQFQQPHLVQEIRELLADTGLPPACLRLEITEHVVIDNIDAAIARLTELRTLGVTLALDDFGTGFSSLSHLCRLPVDALKIDRSFIKEISADPQRLPIIVAMTTLAHTLDIDVTAEGIESAQQAFWLRSARCDHGQGFYFSRPLAVDAIEHQLASGNGWREQARQLAS